MDDVLAAGAVVTRKGGDVVLVHRPRYDDWSFPKGKLDPGEHPTAAAVREVAEETGLTVRLGPPLRGQRYGVGNGRMKSVSYWTARVVGDDDDLSGYAPNPEIDQVQWVPWDKAHELLSYRRDKAVLEAAEPVRRRTSALVVLRHAQARERSEWEFADRRRPLSPVGQDQAERLGPVLSAFGVTGVHTSSSTRCAETVRPFAETEGLEVATYDTLTEEEAREDAVRELVGELLGAKECVVLCAHRPVLPAVLDAIGVDRVKLEKGEMLVVHHREGAVVATELHQS